MIISCKLLKHKIINIINKRLASLNTNSIMFHTLYTSILHIASKCIGFAIPYLVAIKYGVNNNTDAFFISYAIIWFLSVLGSSIGRLTLVPFIAEQKSKNGDVNAFLSNIMKIYFFICLISLIIFLSGTICFLNIANELIQRDTKSILIFIIILSPIVLFYLYGGIFEGYLNYHKQFWGFPCSLALRSLTIIIVFLLLSINLGIFSVAVGYLIGEFILVLSLYLISVKKVGFKYDASTSKNKDLMNQLKHFFHIVSFQIAFTALIAISPLIDKIIAFVFDVGSLSILEYAEKIYLIFYNVIAVVFSKVLLSYWSDSFFLESPTKLKNKILSASKKILIICSPICIIVSSFKIPISRIIFNTGSINAEQLVIIASLFEVFIYQLIPEMLSKVFINYYLINKLTKFLLLIGIIRVVLNIAFDILFINLIGIIGIIYSTLIHTTISVVLFFLYFLKIRR